MVFNSSAFAVFIITVFAIYWTILKNHIKLQNTFLLIASYVFYGWWDWRFLSLIFISSLSDFIIGLKLGTTDNLKKAKVLVTLSVAINLGILGFFKYYNFFVDNFISLVANFGYTINAGTLNIILPVGISFYTFQTMSYTLDIYRKQLKPSSDIIGFFAFVSFFPQLVAGPIERASNLLHQFNTKREFSYEKSAIAMRQILWGLFQKAALADNCGVIVNYIFDDYYNQSGIILVLGAFLFALQIYGDFAGYSNIAIGVAQLLGFQLMQNFQSPYFSQNITEIWRRWHISLSTWLRDYLYTPIAIKTRNWGKWGIVFSTTTTFVICGLWHGASWKFVAFGILHGIALSYEVLTKKIRKGWKKKISEHIYKPLSIILTFTFWTFTLIFFRADGAKDALFFIKTMFTNPFLMKGTNMPFEKVFVTVEAIVILFVILEIIGRKNKFALETLGNNCNRFVRYLFYSFLVFVIFMFFQTNGNPFIYFQF
ncbi:MAG: MBOAT family protein [Salinivirgaceae bacterium]|nr:MBOAT family protein [Salinivirgaceae bacterium]